MLYNRPLPVNRIVNAIADSTLRSLARSALRLTPLFSAEAQTNTQHYGKRPYGVGFLVAGHDVRLPCPPTPPLPRSLRCDSNTHVQTTLRRNKDLISTNSPRLGTRSNTTPCPSEREVNRPRLTSKLISTNSTTVSPPFLISHCSDAAR